MCTDAGRLDLHNRWIPHYSSNKNGLSKHLVSLIAAPFPGSYSTHHWAIVTERSFASAADADVHFARLFSPVTLRFPKWHVQALTMARAHEETMQVWFLADVQASEALTSLLGTALWNRAYSILAHNLMQGIERRMDYGDNDDLWGKH